MNAQNAIAKAEPSLDQLSPRELKIVGLLAAHKSAKEIAADLAISPGTVGGYIRDAREKWDARDRNELARIYLDLVGPVSRYEENAPTNDGGTVGGDDDRTDGKAEAFSDLPTTATFRLSDVFAIEPSGYAEVPPPAGLEVLDSWFGRGWRIAAIPVLALAIAATALVILTIATSMSQGT